MRALVKSLFSFVGKVLETLCLTAGRCLHRRSARKHFTVCIEGNDCNKNNCTSVSEKASYLH